MVSTNEHVRSDGNERCQFSFPWALGPVEDMSCCNVFMKMLPTNYGDLVFDFRLYFLDGKYVFEKDVWRGSKIVEVQMSYLLRRSK